MDYLTYARKVMQTEIEGLRRVCEELDQPFVAMVELALAALSREGKIVVTGVGKSGHVGRKMAATLSSTGSRAAFMHPVEAMHGDLGILSRDDLLVCLSYSGETDELLQILPAARRFEIPIVAITGAPESGLARWCDVVVTMTVDREACPFNLAPTTTTTALMALGDALAMVLCEARGFRKDDYAKLHPSGAIGRAVTLKISDVMRVKERLAIVSPTTLVKEALLRMTECRAGSVLVAGANDELLGIFTDGDFRRRAQTDLEVLQQPVEQVMTRDPIRVRESLMAVEILKLLEHSRIDDIPVVDDANRIVGIVDIQDLPSFKLM